MKLRDHSQSCGHFGAYEAVNHWYCDRCPGGREVTIDYEAITAIIDNVAARVDSEGVTGNFRAKDYTARIVIALGIEKGDDVAAGHPC